LITSTPGYTGWLGNQMFQYAAMRALGLKYDIPTFFPNKDPNLNAIFRTTQSSFIEGEYDSYVEPFYHYQEIPLVSENMVLFGYYQSEKYFKDFEKEIKKEFTFADPNCNPHIAKDKVSIHVRRGDYLNLEDHHPVCSMEYYKEAMEVFGDCNFLIFTDDKEWCQQNFKGEEFTFSFEYNPLHDLELMTYCDHHIIANSSFSWWGAWLGHNKDKKIVAPKKWFGPAKDHDTKDLYCPSWIVV